MPLFEVGHCFITKISEIDCLKRMFKTDVQKTVTTTTTTNVQKSLKKEIKISIKAHNADLQKASERLLNML